jgi:DNA-binding transcriptional MerR regulator
MSQRSYRSIGDVLTLLRAEFPDITISKIRFLESQGLVSPQRSPSGYRKFYDEDVERLRYVLLQQREHFLPLKVIRDRLNEEGAATDVAVETVEVDVAVEIEEMAEVPVGAAMATIGGGAGEVPPAVAAPPVAARPAPTPRPTVADVVAALQEAPPVVAAPAPTPRRGPARPAPVSAPSEDALTAEELGQATGIDVATIDQLVEFGILRPGKVGGLTCFEPTDVAVAAAAARFLAAGVEPRHLRQLRNGVEREASLLEQLTAPMLRQRNPQARQGAEDLVHELASAGAELRAALLEREIEGILGR